jgi:phenylpyruvate tautomerase PptA (4-oxalocrotonate tautomerase family)
MAADTLTVEKKAKIADAITRIHSEEAVGPRYLVQVIFQDFWPSET